METKIHQLAKENKEMSDALKQKTEETEFLKK